MIEVILNGVQNASRLNRNQANMAMAIVMGMRGTCRRAQVGCVITKGNRVVSTGYNGSLGDDHCLKCDLGQKCSNAVHAEANAIAYAAKKGISLEGATIYCTHGPCLECAKIIIQSGISEVYYMHEYITTPGITLLSENNIRVHKI